MIDLALQISPEADEPLHRQIYEQIRAAILTGRLRSHQKLPASRQLAKSLSVSRTTVTQSYDQLISEGYLQTQQGAGTFVCAHIPDSLIETERYPRSGQAKGVEQDSVDQGSFPNAGLSAYGDRLHKTPSRTANPASKFSFAYGVPALDLFPIQTWRRLWNKRSTADTSWMNYSPDPMGYEPLRREISQYVSQARAVCCRPEQILITNGTQQALNLIVQLLVAPGDAIAIEDPGYLSARRIFDSSGATILPVPVDEAGLKVNEPGGLRDLVERHPTPSPKLVYVTPSHQFPTGVLMSLSRRLAILQWAQQNNAFIIEDDYDSEFRYRSRPVPALQGLDSHERVLYVGTFSKVMFPGLRLGYVVLPPSLMPLFLKAKWLSDRQNSLIDQQALHDFIQQGYLAKHVRRMRNIYEQRRRSLVSNLAAVTSPSSCPVKILGDESGLHIMARFSAEHASAPSDHDIVNEAKKQGVDLFSAQPQYYPTARSPINGEFIFGFGNISEQAIEQAIATIKPLLQKLSQRP